MNENKFAVIIATYMRKDGSTFGNLKRVSNFLKNQTYQNFKIFLVGDDYDDKKEFDNIVSLFPKDKIFSYNNNISYRKNYFKIKMNKWTCGGLLARNIGINESIKQGFNYYLHLDDDDEWTNDHIEIINDTINKFPDVDFMINKSKYSNTFLPYEMTKKNYDNNYELKYNNFIPKKYNSVHSSWTVNLKTLGVMFKAEYENRKKFIDKIKNCEVVEKDIMPFDAHLLTKINKLQSDNKIKCILINKCTVTKKSDCNIPQ